MKKHICFLSLSSQFNPSEYAQQKAMQEAIKTGFLIAGTQFNDELSYYRTRNRILTPLQESELKLSQLREKEAQIAIDLHTQEKELTQLRIEEAKYDRLIKKAQAFQAIGTHLPKDDKYAANSPQLLKKELMELNGDSPKQGEESSEKKAK